MIRRAVQFVFAIVLLVPGTTWAEEKPPEIVRMRVGFDGRYKVGHWTPVEITVVGGSRQMTGPVSLSVPDGDGVPSRVLTPAGRPCLVTPGRESAVLVYARFGRIDSEPTACFHVDGKVVAHKTFQTDMEVDDDHFLPAIVAVKELIVTVGRSSVGVREAARLSRLDPEIEAEVVRLPNADRLPTRWYGYDGVDVVVLPTSRPEVYRALWAQPSARLEALDEWVRLGGKLVLCVGSQAEEILAPDGPLARFAPGRLERMVRLRDTAGLESYVGSSTPVPRTAGRMKLDLRVPRLTEIKGTIEVLEGNLPLVVRGSRGFGQVVFVAVDLDRAPFADWKDRPLLTAKLLDMPTHPVDEAGKTSAIIYYGYGDIAGQLRSALDRFKGVQLVPFGAVVALVLFYILLIGPGDFFLLRKLRRMEWTWFTFPLVVIVFSAGAYLLAYQLKGNKLRINQVDLVDVDTESGLVRGTSWANIFSPRMETYNLTFRPQLPNGKTPDEAKVLVSWLGLPGQGLGGMNPRTSNPSIWRRHYDFSPELDAMLGVPIQVWSTKSLTSRWSARADVGLKADLTQKDDLPSGTITNSLDFPLKQCIFVYERWAYELGTLEPGETVDIDQLAERSELKTLLTGRRMIFDQNKDKVHQQATPYDFSSVDIPYILQAMMFYEAAGGSRYTQLLNRYQRFVDLSGLLKTDRAILVAHGPSSDEEEKHHGARLLRDGQPMAGPENQHLTVYRFVFPVETSVGGRQ